MKKKNRANARILFVLLAAGAFAFFGLHISAHAQEQERVLVSAFVRDDCGHCADEKKFLSQLASEEPALEVRYYNLAEEKNKTLFTDIAEHYALVKGTPITLIAGNLISGFESTQTTGETIRQLAAKAKAGENPTFEDIAEGGAVVFGGSGATCSTETVCPDDSFVVRIPLIGAQIDVGAWPLFALSATLGFIDGFNPCALWVLVMFLLILSQVGSRKRMVQYAGLFIFAEAVMYYLILSVWMTAWDFIALDRIVTPAVGLLALGSGIYFLYRFLAFKPECSIASIEQQKTIADKVKTLAAKPFTFSVVAGILVLAFSVNVFEFACSIGIPQTFTKIIEMNALSWLGRQGYMATYILTYMVDDLIVFGIALYSIKKINATKGYARWSSLIGGLLMLLLGLLMLFRPDILVF